MAEKNLTLTETREVRYEDGELFARMTIEYPRLSLADVVEFEAELLELLNKRLAWAKARVPA